MPGVRTRRAPLAIGALLALAALAAGCASGSSPTGGNGGSAGCDHWCGNGSATVTIGAATTTISGGGCYDGGSAGVDARFGDWGPNGTGDYLEATAYRAGGPTPTPAATLSNPSASEYPSPNVSGNVGGNPFILGPDTIVTLTADGTGSFSGTDLNGAGLVKGTFSCS
jgi:hypothetical protein